MYAGNGMRGCIGRPFAWQEALLVTAMLLQYFNFAPEDPSYTLQIKVWHSKDEQVLGADNSHSKH